MQIPQHSQLKSRVLNWDEMSGVGFCGQTSIKKQSCLISVCTLHTFALWLIISCILFSHILFCLSNIWILQRRSQWMFSHLHTPPRLHSEVIEFLVKLFLEHFNLWNICVGVINVGLLFLHHHIIIMAILLYYENILFSWDTSSLHFYFKTSYKP